MLNKVEITPVNNYNIRDEVNIEPKITLWHSDFLSWSGITNDHFYFLM